MLFAIVLAQTSLPDAGMPAPIVAAVRQWHACYDRNFERETIRSRTKEEAVDRLLLDCATQQLNAEAAIKDSMVITDDLGSEDKADQTVIQIRTKTYQSLISRVARQKAKWDLEANSEGSARP